MNDNLPIILENEDLSRWTSWQIGGPAEFFSEPKTISELIALKTWAQSKGHKFQVLGGGSNVLVSDLGIRGLTLSLGKLNKVSFKEVQSQNQPARLEIEAEAGVLKAELLKVFLKHKLAPALFLAGIPGEVGGGIVMNAGISEDLVPREFEQIVDWFDVLKPDNSIKRYQASDIKWTYRHSQGWEPGIVIKAGLSWALDPDPKTIDKVRQLNQLRLQKQPIEWPSCGSVFINPLNNKAAQLIDRSGLKGTQIGQAQVSLKHANFIINLGQATATDTWNLILHVKKTVQEKQGIELKTEVIRLGDWSNG